MHYNFRNFDIIFGFPHPKLVSKHSYYEVLEVNLLHFHIRNWKFVQYVEVPSLHQVGTTYGRCAQFSVYIYLYQTSTFELYVVQIYSRTYIKRPCAKTVIIILGSIVNMRIFILILNKMFKWVPTIMKKMSTTSNLIC